MERFFQVLAVILVGIAAYFLLRGNTDGTFVAGVFGAVAFFLSIRFQIKARLDKREAERFALETEEENFLSDEIAESVEGKKSEKSL